MAAWREGFGAFALRAVFGRFPIFAVFDSARADFGLRRLLEF